MATVHPAQTTKLGCMPAGRQLLTILSDLPTKTHTNQARSRRVQNRVEKPHDVNEHMLRLRILQDLANTSGFFFFFFFSFLFYIFCTFGYY